MLSPEEEARESRISDAIRELETPPGNYHPCGVEHVDEAYPMIMQDRPREKPASCKLRRSLVRNYLDQVESALD